MVLSLKHILAIKLSIKNLTDRSRRPSRHYFAILFYFGGLLEQPKHPTITTLPPRMKAWTKKLSFYYPAVGSNISAKITVSPHLICFHGMCDSKTYSAEH